MTSPVPIEGGRICRQTVYILYVKEGVIKIRKSCDRHIRKFPKAGDDRSADGRDCGYKAHF